jgi:acylpyruvate hydrolase
MLALLQAGDKMWEVLTATMHWLESAASASAIASVIRPLSQIHLRPLISNPSKIICIGLNYYDHCREQGVEVPKRPLFFAKFPSAIIGPDDSITWPADVSDQVDFEAELAVIIKRKARNIITDKVDEFIAGYTILNDISARDVQFADGQWTRGKSFDSFCPIGPYLVTCDEVGDPHRLAIRCWINGRLMQDSNTSELIFNVPYLLMYTSKTCTLLPGDIISTGTPGGVGVFRTPSVFLKSGDTVEIEIEKLGRLRNLVQ